MPQSISLLSYPDLNTALWVQGFEIVNISGTILTINPGSARSTISQEVMALTSQTAGQAGFLQIDTSTIGLFGCYPDPLGSGDPVNLNALVLIWDASGFNPPGLIVASSPPGVNLAPPGYTDYAIVGMVMSNSSGNLLAASYSGAYNRRSVSYPTVQNIVTGGTSATPYPIVAISNYGLVPLFSATINLVVQLTAPTGGGGVVIAPFNVALTSSSPNIFATTLAGTFTQVMSVQIPPSNSVNSAGFSGAIQYMVTTAGTSVNIGISSFEIELPVVTSVPDGG